MCNTEHDINNCDCNDPERDESHLMDLEFDEAIERFYGPDVIHITNLSSWKDAELAKKAAKSIPSVFIGKAFIGDGSQEDKSSIGLYTTNSDDISAVGDIISKS